MRRSRKIIKIDEAKCNGCGLCVPACAEGAITIVDGKARLVSDVYCDGLGACLGHCPQNALTIEEREAEAFDAAVVARTQRSGGPPEHEHHPAPITQPAPPAHACPGTFSRFFDEPADKDPGRTSDESAHQPSALRNWPVQLRLAPIQAPYFDAARLLIAADCVPFALAGFHRELLEGQVLLIGCPKLDDAQAYHRKLTEIFRQNDIAEIEVAHMEVPCCHGLVRLVQSALADSGKDIPLRLTQVGIRGQLFEPRTAPTGAIP